jgi:hypothetical protein
MKKYGKDYTFPAQDTLLALLKRYHSVNISRRTLNYWLKYLTDMGLLKRIKRCQKVGRKFMSTMYQLADESNAAGKVRHAVGVAKRLSRKFRVRENRVQKTAHYTKSTELVYGDGLKRPPSNNKGIKEKASCHKELEEKIPNIESTEETGPNRELFKAQLDWLRKGKRQRLFGKEPNTFFNSKKQED